MPKIVHLVTFHQVRDPRYDKRRTQTSLVGRRKVEQNFDSIGLLIPVHSITGMDVQTLKDICFEGAKEAKQLSGEVEKEICWYEQETIPGLWIAFYIFCILWLFVAIAIICDDFFVPSLEAISGNSQFPHGVKTSRSFLGTTHECNSFTGNLSQARFLAKGSLGLKSN